MAALRMFRPSLRSIGRTFNALASQDDEDPAVSSYLTGPAWVQMLLQNDPLYLLKLFHLNVHVWISEKKKADTAH